jgi:hypothetical protein
MENITKQFGRVYCTSSKEGALIAFEVTTPLAPAKVPVISKWSAKIASAFSSIVLQYDVGFCIELTVAPVHQKFVPNVGESRRVLADQDILVESGGQATNTAEGRVFLSRQVVRDQRQVNNFVIGRDVAYYRLGKEGTRADALLSKSHTDTYTCLPSARTY